MYNFCSSSAETFNIVRLILAKYAERPFDAYLHSVVEQIRELVSFQRSEHIVLFRLLGKHSRKKKRNFMKKFHKTVTPPPYCFYEILIQNFDRISSTYVVLNKRYEIRLTPPPRL